MKLLKELFPSVAAGLAILACATLASAMDEAQRKEFDRIASLSMKALTEEASARVEAKYTDEHWDNYNFPQFVYVNESAETGYMIAVKEPQLLSKIFCYCFCDRIGHKNLFHCFLKQGKVGGEYDRHASRCNICYGQAMVGFLWSELGASDAEIAKGMEAKFKLKQ